MRLSIIVPAHNGERDLPYLLAALQSIPGPGDELIVVDDHSSDQTRACARAFPNLRLVCLPECSGAAAARNAGAAAAASDASEAQRAPSAPPTWPETRESTPRTAAPFCACSSEAQRALVFFDADVVPHPDALSALRQRLIDQPGLAAVMGSYDDRPAHPALISQYRNLLHCYTHRKGNPEASTFWTGCGIVRRDWFDLLGGFNPAISFMEDIDFGMRLKQAGGRILLDPSIQVQHRKGWTFWALIRMDIFQRALPWARLLLRAPGGFLNDLNVRTDQRASTALACLAVLAAFFAWWEPTLLGLAVASLAGVAILNRGFYQFLLVRKGWVFMLAAFGLHLVHFWCSALGFGLALAERLRTPG